MVFTCSWSDWFHPAADAWRDEAWDVIRAAPQHTYQILTKRPECVLEHLPADWGNGWPNVWLGVSIENRRFVHRADLLRQVPAVVRFVSAEPLLGPLVPDGEWDDDGDEAPYAVEFCHWSDGYERSSLDLTGIDWLIVGGESGGRRSRSLVRDSYGGWQPKTEALAWVRDLRDVAAATGTAFLFKQWGGPRPTSGGRLLDGRTWDEMPEAVAA